MTFLDSGLPYPKTGRARRRASAIASAVAAVMLFSAVGPHSARSEEDPRDRSYAMEQVNQALETQRTAVEVPWRNPETASTGIIVVERTFYRDTGEPCREYRRTRDRSGAPSQVFRGTGCRVGPARWEIDETEATPAEAPSTGTGTGTGTGKPSASGRAPAPETKTASPQSPPAAARTPPPSTTTDTARGTADKPASRPDPAPPAPPVSVVKAPRGKPEAFTTYTLPSQAKL